MITSRIGGTSGPIWGTAFLRAGAAATGKTELTGEDVVAMLRASIEGIKQRGNADLGDKTLLDALLPAVDELEAALAAASRGHRAAGNAPRGRPGGAEATKRDAREARPRRVHGRTQHRHAGRRGRRGRGDVRTVADDWAGRLNRAKGEQR